MISTVAPTSLSAPSTQAALSSRNPKLDGAVQQFEALLMNQLLASSRTNNASLTGTDDDGDQQGQVQDFADQMLAGQLAKSDCLGLARMLGQTLQARQSSRETIPSR